MKFYEQGREKGGFEAGIRLAVQSILMSPRFLFRLEQQPASLSNGAIRNANFRLADEDIASRLSFFLWGTVPDAELIRAASLGSLQTAGGHRQAGPPHAGRQALGSAVDALCVAVAAPAGPRQDLPGLPAVSAVRRHARARR